MRVDYSLRRLVHYTGCDWREVQPWILLTNYHRYVDQFVRVGLDTLKSGAEGYERLILPGGVVVAPGEAARAGPAWGVAGAPGGDAGIGDLVGAADVEGAGPDGDQQRALDARAVHLAQVVLDGDAGLGRVRHAHLGLEGVVEARQPFLDFRRGVEVDDDVDGVHGRTSSPAYATPCGAPPHGGGAALTGCPRRPDGDRPSDHRRNSDEYACKLWL